MKVSPASFLFSKHPCRVTHRSVFFLAPFGDPKHKMEAVCFAFSLPHLLFFQCFSSLPLGVSSCYTHPHFRLHDLAQKCIKYTFRVLFPTKLRPLQTHLVSFCFPAHPFRPTSLDLPSRDSGFRHARTTAGTAALACDDRILIHSPKREKRREGKTPNFQAGKRR